MEALPTRLKGGDLYRPQDFKVHFYIKGTHQEAKKVDRVSGDYDLYIQYHPGKGNVVPDALR